MYILNIYVSFSLVFKLHIMFMRDRLLGYTILVQSDSVGFPTLYYDLFFMIHYHITYFNCFS